MQTLATEEIIEQIIQATYGDALDARRRHVFGQALQGLVRQARVEQMLEFRLDVKRAASVPVTDSSRRQAQVLLRRIGQQAHRGQRQLEFDRQDSDAESGSAAVDGDRAVPGSLAPRASEGGDGSPAG